MPPENNTNENRNGFATYAQAERRVHDILEYYTDSPKQKKKKTEVIKPCDLSEVVESDKKDTEERKSEKPVEKSTGKPKVKKEIEIGEDGDGNGWYVYEGDDATAIDTHPRQLGRTYDFEEDPFE